MTSRADRDPAVGERIRARRLMRGWSIRYAASCAGISHATWSRIERGLQAADNRYMLAAIAAALGCSPSDLTDTPVSGVDRSGLLEPAGVAAVRQVLVDLDLAEASRGLSRGPARPMPELARRVALVDSFRHTCDYVAASRLLPNLLRDLHAACGTPDRRQALRLLCEAAFIASCVLRNLGHPAEAWLAGDLCRGAAEATEDSVLIGYAAYVAASAAAACGSLQRGVTLAERAIDNLHRHAHQPGGLAVLGSLQLICAYANVSLHRLDDGRTWSAEAAGVAARTGETTTLGFHFGPTNVNIWRVGIEVDSGDPVRAAEIAQTTNPSVIPTEIRQVFFYVDTARAYAQLHDDRRAIRFLLIAERIAPQHMHSSASAQATAWTLLQRSRQRMDGLELRGLCERMRLT